MRARTVSRSLAALAVGLAAMAADAATSQSEPRTIIGTTTVTVHGAQIVLAKYLKDGQVCQQFVDTVTDQTHVSGEKTWAALVREICDVPETRPGAAGLEVFPKKLTYMEKVKSGDVEIQVPRIGLEQAPTQPNTR